MAPARLSDSQKQELVSQFKAGVTAAALAEAFGCSPNTVSRTVKALLSPEEYESLKQKRSGRGAAAVAAKADEPKPDAVKTEATPEAASPEAELEADEPLEGSSSLALDDADDFGADEPEGDADEGSEAGFPGGDEFHEVAVLPVDLPQVNTQEVPCQPFVAGVLPETVYMLVDKTVELDPRPLSDFPELGVADPDEQALQALCLFTSPRTAKRQCGRSQRVIKVPDPQVFAITTRYLVARGITRLVVEGALYALDA